MNQLRSCLYVGDVGHKRVAPVQHSLRYRVYNFFVDVDELAKLGKSLRWFCYNKFNIFSITDKKFGAGDGTSVSENAWRLVRAAGAGEKVKRIFMLCYPAVLGRIFNPLTTYYCYDCDETLQLMIYEVSNTFGERHTYVVSPENNQDAKKFYVSPFNKVEGTYDFSAPEPDDKLTLSVSLRVNDRPVLQAWFNGERRALNDTELLRSFFSLPMLPLKVVAGIHWEALKLWMKGLKLQTRPAPLSPNISFTSTQKTEPHK
jgi:uncharacterized protein